MQLRPYQNEAKNAVFSEWESGNLRTLLVLPTGCGKTIVFAKIAEECVRRGDRVLILAHRGELLDQAADKIQKATGLNSSVEKAEQSCIGSWNRVVVGSVQTLMREKRLSNFDSDYFDTIIIDEAHHSISDSYRRVLEHFDNAKVLGVTATPDRGDMKNLGTVFDSLAYEYTLPKAIKEGYLTPIKAVTIPLTLDLSGVATQAGDFKASDIDTALDPYLYQIAEEMKKYCKDRKTVVFLPTKVRGLYCQMVGRGTRLAPNKTELLLLDFLWHTERHELCRPAHLICDNDDVAQKMTENLSEQAGCPIDIEEAEEKASEDVVAQHEEALANQLAEMRTRKRKLVDPLQYEMSIQAQDLAGYVPAFGWECSPPTDKQKAKLEKLGIFPDEIQSAGKAKLILDRLEKRRIEGLTTPKQIRMLESRGFQHVGKWQFDEASALISRIAANGWRTPKNINPKTYVPQSEVNTVGLT